MPSHIQSSIPDAKLRRLKELIRTGVTIDVAQVMEVRWPQPTGTRYYAKSRHDLSPNFASIPFRPIEYRVLNSSEETIDAFALSSNYEVGAEPIQLTLIDHDLYFRTLFKLHEEGAQVHIWQYLPQIDHSVNIWWGLLDPPSKVEDGLMFTTATFGTRSPQAMLPGRVMSVTKCQAAPFFGGKLKTQKEIDRGGCPYNVHIGGTVGNVDPATGKHYASCDGTSTAVCLARIGGDVETLPIKRFASILGSEAVAQTKGANTLATTRGNESALNVPCAIVAGERIVRELPVLTFQVQTNRKHPEKGSVSAIFPVADHSCESLSEPAINDTLVTNSPGTSQNQFLYNLGADRQRALNLTGTQKAANYSGVTHWRGLIFGNFAGQGASNFKGKVKVVGNNEIYRWTGSNAGSIGYSTNRAEFVYWCLTNLRAGLGEPEENFESLDWQVAAAACDELVGYADAGGNFYQSKRSTISAYLEGRKADEQLRDLCLAGNLTAPFMFEGKRRIFSLKKEILDRSIPVFTDKGIDPTIDSGPNGLRSIQIQKKKPYELYNFLKVWFEDREYEYVRRPLIFVYDRLIDARRAIGANPLNPFEISLVGVVEFGEAVRVGQIYGDLGPFQSGGVENNCRVVFRSASIRPEVMQLHPYKIIKVESDELAEERESSGRPFEYFRVLNLEQSGDWMTTITAQAYPVDYMERVEDSEQPPPKTGSAGEKAPNEVIVAG